MRPTAPPDDRTPRRRRPFARSALGVLLLALLCAASARGQEAGKFDWSNYFAGRTVCVAGEGGLALLTDSHYLPVDYYPGYGFSIDYYLPAVLAIGLEFEQNEKQGTIKLPTSNYGNLDARGRLTLTAYSLQFKISTPVSQVDERVDLNLFLEGGIGTYVANLDVKTKLTVQYLGTRYAVNYALKYTAVDPGVNGGLGMDVVVWERLKIGFVARIHYLLEKEKEANFGAMNLFLRFGYTM